MSVVFVMFYSIISGSAVSKSTELTIKGWWGLRLRTYSTCMGLKSVQCGLGAMT